MSFLSRLFGSYNPRQDVTPAPEHKAVTPEGEPIVRRILSNDDPACVTDTSHKLALADRIVDNYLQSGGDLLPFAIPRMVDIRLCSFMAYRLAKDLFGPEGFDLHSSHPELAKYIGLKLSHSGGKLMTDSGLEGWVLLPVKFRGYGYPINSPMHKGNLFQINLCAFPEDGAFISISDTGSNGAVPVKGLCEIGVDSEGGKIFRIDRTLTDDMTAVFINPLLLDEQLEVKRILRDGTSETIYRFALPDSSKVIR